MTRFLLQDRNRSSIRKDRADQVVQSVECLLFKHRTYIQSPASTFKMPGVVAHAHDPRTGEGKTGALGASGQSD